MEGIVNGVNYSDRYFKGFRYIKWVYNLYPDIIFGGSLALWLSGILHRTINDLDLVIWKDDLKLPWLLSELNKLNTPNYDEAHNKEHSKHDKELDCEIKKFDMDGINKLNQDYKNHIDLIILNQKPEYYIKTITYDKNPITIRVQQPRKIIEAKQVYVKRYGISKHVEDLKVWEKWKNNPDRIKNELGKFLNE